jgi:putative PIN family toxin of toxin-antitoxin system
MWVLDTDVVVAALRSRTGASAEIVRRVLRREVQIGISVALALEYEAVTTRPEHLAASGLGEDEALVVIDALIGAAHPVDLHFLWRPQLRDADDEMVLEAAVNCRASAIVTFNRRDFGSAAKRFGIELLLPAMALETLG